MTNRTRTRGSTNNPLVYNRELRMDGSLSNPTPTANGQTVGSSEVFQDVVTKEFKKIQSEGALVNSPMTQTKLTLESEPRTTSWKWVQRQPPYWSPSEVVGFSCNDPIALRYGTLSFPSTKLPGWDETKAGLALAQARSKASAPTAMSLVTVAEARETFRLMQGAVELALKRTEPFRVLRRRYETGKLSYKDFLVEAANLDLLVRYGLMPLIYDIGNYVEALTSPPKPERLTARAAVFSQGSENWTTTASSSMVASISLSHSLTWNTEYRATVLFEAVDDMQSRLGLRLADVPTSLWEATRLSFVADWFFNTGSYLSSLTLGARASVLLQCVREYTTAQYIALYAESGSKTSATADTVCISDGSGAKVSHVFTRKTRRPYPNTSIGSWGTRINLTPARIIDGLSLLATNLDISSRKRLVRI